MKRLIALAVAVLTLSSASLLMPAKAEAHSDFLVNIARMTTVVPTFVVRHSLFFAEGLVDGLIEGFTTRRGFFHGENRYINSGTRH